MRQISIHNSLSQKKEVLTPLEPGHVKIYLCGPTVYGFVHVGNTRGPIFFNFVRNYLEHSGYKVTLVYNYTDVDDKIINAANESGISAQEHAEKYIKEFEKDFVLMGLRKATHNPRVTETMPEIIQMIEKIVQNGHGYAVGGDVYLSVTGLPEYGKLSHKNIDDLRAGARVEIGDKKKNPLDFALWKGAKPGEPFWESPWGKGRPGWHIECSAMAKKLLGETFDIHGGGIDLIFPHHENEIAQSECANGKPFVRYWMHNNFINMGKEKMSKSLGNIFTARQFLTQFNGEILKFLILSSHYRTPSDFSESVIDHSIAGLARIYSSLAQAEKWLQKCQAAGFVGNSESLPKGEFSDQVSKFWEKIYKACDDDFNSPEVMAEIFSLVRVYNKLLRPGMKPTQDLANVSARFKAEVEKVGKILSLFQESPCSYLDSLDDMLLKQKNLNRSDIDKKVSQRWKFKSEKNFAEADKLRVELTNLGIEIRDTADGSEWEVKK